MIILWIIVGKKRVVIFSIIKGFLYMKHMKHMKHGVRSCLMLLAAVAVFLPAGCKTESDDDSSSGSVTAVTVTASSLSVTSGSAVTLSAAVTYSGSVDTTVTWTKTDTSSTGSTLSATTGSSVTLTAGSAASGSVVVTATAGGVSKSVTIVVSSTEKAVTAVTVTAANSTISAAGSTTLSAALTPTAATYKSLTWAITSGSSYASLSATSGTSVTLTGTNTTTSAQSVTITATTDNSTVGTVTVTVSASSSSTSISAGDSPTGFASYSAATNFGGYGGTTVTVSNRADLLTYAKKGGYVIYVNGLIDMTGGCLPSSATDNDTELGAFISTYTSGTYTTWSGWRTAYAAACSTTSDYSTDSNTTLDGYQTKLVNAWKALIQIPVASNTTIIGLTSLSGIQGGTISISGVSNVAIRNMIIEDAFDPFPHHEDGDGFNAQYDGITVQGTGTANIWIDHCTFADTICTKFSDFAYPALSTGATEMWQTYDGLCDIKGSGQYITVSYCKFMDHDKTMLIGSSDTEGSNATRSITLNNNYFLNCVQRLPMVRNTSMHIYNNYYESGTSTSSTYTNSYAVGVRNGSLVVSQNNYFGSGIEYSYDGSSTAPGTVYYSGDSDNAYSGKHSGYFTYSSSMPFTPASYYSYTLKTAAAAKTDVLSNAGAGVWSVSQ
jgi:pectate lyase